MSIDVNRVSKRYGSHGFGLRDLTLRFNAGERVALIGTNGSGKTTLLRAMLGLVRVEGEVTIDGASVRAEPEVALRDVAYMPQVAPPIDVPTREVVKAWSRLRGKPEESVWMRSERLGLFPDAVQNKRFRDLSGGMRQKILAAMALAAEPKILMCDEPTANLDATARQAFFDMVATLSPETLLLMCSHRREELAQRVTRIVELQDGVALLDQPSHQREVTHE